MKNDKYTLKYLPLYEEDLNGIIDYISFELQSPENALKLLDRIEKSILNRLDCPLSFEPYQSTKKRENPYYRIYVGNFTVYYVVIGDVMEIRRILYNRRDSEHLLK